MNVARFDDNGRLVHERSRERTITDHVVTRAHFSESCHGARDIAWSELDSDTRVSIVRALLGAMSDEEQALFSDAEVEALAAELAESRAQLERAVTLAESLKAEAVELGHIKSVAAQHGHRDGDVGDFVAKKLAELSYAKDDFERICASERTLAGVLTDAKAALENHGYSPRSTVGSINRMAEDLAAAKEQLSAAMQAAADNATDVEILRSELAEAKHAVRGYYEPEAGLASAIRHMVAEAEGIARESAALQDADKAHPEPYMREALANALEVTHPELGVPDWGLLLADAADKSAIVREMRKAMRGNMGEE